LTSHCTEQAPPPLGDADAEAEAEAEADADGGAERDAEADIDADGDVVVDGGKRTTRSSVAAGVPRPSRLLVVTQSQPSGPTTTVRRRP
jgi:hypothetical protein